MKFCLVRGKIVARGYKKKFIKSPTSSRMQPATVEHAAAPAGKSEYFSACASGGQVLPARESGEDEHGAFPWLVPNNRGQPQRFRPRFGIYPYQYQVIRKVSAKKQRRRVSGKARAGELDRSRAR